jgi:hypothetical protein
MFSRKIAEENSADFSYRKSRENCPCIFRHKFERVFREIFQPRFATIFPTKIPDVFSSVFPALFSEEILRQKSQTNFQTKIHEINPSKKGGGCLHRFQIQVPSSRKIDASGWR